MVVLSLLLTSIFANTVFASEEGVSPRIDFSVTMRIAVSHSSEASSSDLNVGHAFLVFYNDSSQAVTIGRMSVGAGEYVTIGTYGNRSTHKGIWYNVEGYTQPADTISLAYSISSSQLATINSTINANDDYEDVTNNCCHFATRVWNAIVPSSLDVTGGLPDTLYNSVCSISGYTNYSVPYKPIDSIAYQNGNTVTYDTSGASRH